MVIYQYTIMGEKINDIRGWFLTLYNITLKIRNNINKLVYLLVFMCSLDCSWRLNSLSTALEPIISSWFSVAHGKTLQLLTFWLWTLSVFCVTSAASFIASMRYLYKLNNEIIVSTILGAICLYIFLIKKLKLQNLDTVFYLSPSAL